MTIVHRHGLSTFSYVIELHIPCDILQITRMAYQSYNQPGNWLLNNITKMRTPGIHLIAFVCYRSSITHENSCSLHSVIRFALLFCVCTSTFSYNAHMKLTLLILVNLLAAMNISHFPIFQCWHMVSIICHQRRMTVTFLSKLVCDFKSCHQSMISLLPNYCFQGNQPSYQIWMTLSTFVQYAIEKYCEIHIMFCVNVVKEMYIEIVLLYCGMIFFLFKIVQPGSADCAMKMYFLLIT